MEKFEGSQIKINRARAFVEELKSLIVQYNKDVPATLNYTTNKEEFHIEIIWKALPRHSGAVLGDAVHNLRSSLDLMMCELARTNSGNDSDVFFPFANSAAELEALLNRNKSIWKIGTEAMKLLKSLGPFKGGNEYLHGLHKLDIQDKHTAVLETARFLKTRVEFENYDPSNFEKLKPFLKEKQVIEHYFPPDSPFPNAPLFFTLNTMVSVTEGIVKMFEPYIKCEGKGD